MGENKKQTEPKRSKQSENASVQPKMLLRTEEKGATQSSKGKLTVPKGTEWTHYDEFA